MGETPSIIIAKFAVKSKEKAAAEIKRSKFKKRLDFYGGYAVYYVSAERRTHISRGGAGVARRAHNPKVGSSNLPPATKRKKDILGDVLFRFRREPGMRTSENALAFSQVLRYRNLRHAPARRKTKVQNLPPATNNANRKRYRFEKPRNHSGFGVLLCHFLK